MSLRCLTLSYSDSKMPCLRITNNFYLHVSSCSSYVGWTGSNFEWLILKWMQLSKDYMVYPAWHSLILIFCVQPSSSSYTLSFIANGNYYSLGFSLCQIKYAVRLKLHKWQLLFLKFTLIIVSLFSRITVGTLWS